MSSAALTYAHTGTPSLQVSDARGLPVRAVQLYRREGQDPIETRVTEQRMDAAARLLASRDAYLFELARTDELTPFNLTQVTSLSGMSLLTESVDAGWRVLLAGDAGQAVERWDGRGSHSLTEYDDLLRPVAVRESGLDVVAHTLERFTWAGIETDAITHNVCGQLVRHDDPAGTVQVNDLNMAGEVLSHTRRFLLRMDPPDWPVLAADRDALLETADGATTSCQFSSAGELLMQTDALHNRQAFAYTVAGQLKETRLTLAGEGQVEKLLVSDIHYNVMGQIEAETAGNGVITRHCYDEANGRLTELSAQKANGTPLQVLNYQYDAVGNVLSIEDAAQPIRYFNNQRITPVKKYRYDTLYQLIEATGCEAKSGQSGPAALEFHTLPIDPSQIANYTQTYHYDAAGNLLELVHLGAQAHGRTLTRERYSNRCLPERDNRPPTEEELAKGFDANGNLRELQAGQPLGWDLRNQLSAVQLIVRKNAEDDRECYVYDGGGQRVRKVNVSQSNARTLTREVRYLPGLQIRMHDPSEGTFHVITASAGSNSVQVLHWVAKRPSEVAQDQLRYSLNDHLKSSALELDQHADLISQEWYYPFGGTAYWAGANAVEAQYKTVSYSGKERDATGLYYYGFRYYAPWLQRWINPDPAGPIDGLNFYRMVRNNPISLHDPNGLTPEGDIARQILSSEDFLAGYKENPQAALQAMASVFLENGKDKTIVKLALKRVKEKLAPPMQSTSNAQVAPRLPKKVIEKPKEDYDFKMFSALYTTTYGSSEINNSMRSGAPIKLLARKIINQLEVRLGTTEFEGRHGKETRKDIEASAKTFDLSDAAKVSYQLYKQDNTSVKTYYRGHSLIDSAFAAYKTARDDGIIVHSKSFLSVSKDENVAKEFLRDTQGALFVIEGFSASNMNGHYAASAVDGSIFSPHADFEVTRVKKGINKQPHVIHLREIRGHSGNRQPMPH